MNRAIPQDLLNGIKKAGFHKPDHCAFVLDFTGIPATRSRFVFCAFIRYIEEGCLADIHAKLLSDNAISVLVENGKRHKMASFVENLNYFLLSRRYGSLDIRIFDLDAETSEFALCCVEYMRHGGTDSAKEYLDFHQEAPGSTAQIGQLIDLERVVGQADMSMHVRLQSIWCLEKGKQPARYGEEMWVSMAAMEEITGKNILRDDWMFARFTELLDSRVLSHITKERSIPPGRQFLNLNPVAVVSANFDRMTKTLPMRQLRELTVEIALPVWRSNVDAANGILMRFERYGITLALDAIPLGQLGDLRTEEIAASRFLKLFVATAGPDAITQALANCPADLIDRIVLCRCETTEQIAAGVEAGVKYYQGYGLPEFLDRPEEIERTLGKGTADNIAASRKHWSRR